MNSDEFWCRAFIAAMGGNYTDAAREIMDHDTAATYAEKAADAHLAVAQRRGMVTAGDVAKAPVERPASEPVEFTAAPADHGQWVLRVSDLSGGFLVPSGLETVGVNGVVVRIQWGDAPPRPIKVWLERGGA